MLLNQETSDYLFNALPESAGQAFIGIDIGLNMLKNNCKTTNIYTIVYKRWAELVRMRTSQVQTDTVLLTKKSRIHLMRVYKKIVKNLLSQVYNK